MKVAYIAHPIKGDVESNLAEIRDIVRNINLNQPDVVPFAPYYLDCVAMDDGVIRERIKGIKNDHELLKRAFVDELWLFGPQITDGMKGEIEIAARYAIPIRPMTSGTVRDLIAINKELGING